MKKWYTPFCAGLLLLIPSLSHATIYPFHNNYSGGQEVPANASPGTGTIVGTYNDVTNTRRYR